jgi:hypothetical protein
MCTKKIIILFLMQENSNGVIIESGSCTTCSELNPTTLGGCGPHCIKQIDNTRCDSSCPFNMVYQY